VGTTSAGEDTHLAGWQAGSVADLVLQPDVLRVQLGRWEGFGTFQRSFDIPWDHIVYAEAASDMWPRVRGWRLPGIGIPHVILVGRMRFKGGQDFCALIGTKPGIVLELRDEPYERVLATASNAAPIVSRVTRGT
jgi:hypothetical protein